MDKKVPLCGTFKFDEISGQCVKKEVAVNPEIPAREIPAIPAIPASCPSGYEMSESSCFEIVK